MRLLTKIVFLTLLTTVAYGQDIEITVRVLDHETKKPIKKANVVVSGTTRGTITNALGFFRITLAPTERRLQISHVSYRTQDIEVPVDVSTFTVPLLKQVYYLTAINLRNYPDNFKLENAKLREIEKKNLSQDSMIVIESLADFPYGNGVNTFVKFFGNTFQFPEKELKQKQEGEFLLEFVVDENGDYKSIRCLSIDPAGAFCDECKRVLSILPTWTPAQQRGENMQQTFVMRIYFGLNDHWKKKLRELRGK